MSRIILALLSSALIAAATGVVHAGGAADASRTAQTGIAAPGAATLSAAASAATVASAPSPSASAPTSKLPPAAKLPAQARGAGATASGGSRNRAAADQQKLKDDAEREAARDAEVRRLETEFAQAMTASQYKEATRLLAALRERLPDTRLGIMRRAAWLHQAQGDLASARTWLERLVARLPNDLNAQLNLALIEAREGRQGAAIERVRALKFHHPHSPTLDHVLSLLELG